MDELVCCRIQADAIITSSQTLYAPGQIVLRHGEIVEVTNRITDKPDVLLEDCVLLPGLINPHTHLEFSDLTHPLPIGKSFPDWIRNVLAQRQQASLAETQRVAAIISGLIESRAAGVVALGDIVTAPWQPQTLQVDHNQSISSTSNILNATSLAAIAQHAYRADGLPQVVAYLEQLGLSPQRRQAMIAWREQVLGIDHNAWPVQLIDLAFSPHAPYSTPPELCQELSQLAARRGSCLAMHVLESPAEREWLDAGTGPMADMLSQFGAAEWRLPKNYFSQLCQQLSQARSTLLIHGNYLTDDELACVARHDNMSLVYCPRTHQHFAHKPYPLASIQQHGIRLLIGTDSRSTNPDLNLWQDARVGLQSHSQLRPSQAFSAITDSAAAALGVQHLFGQLVVGRRAALNVIHVAAPIATSLEPLLEQLFETAISPQPLSHLA